MSVTWRFYLALDWAGDAKGLIYRKACGLEKQPCTNQAQFGKHNLGGLQIPGTGTDRPTVLIDENRIGSEERHWSDTTTCNCSLHSPSKQNMMNTRQTTYLLTGDIGGTNSRMYLYDPEKAETPLCHEQYRNAKHIPEDCHDCPNVFQENIITPFLRQCWESGSSKLEPIGSVMIVAVFAIAGVVDNNKVHLTNLGNMPVDGWAIESQTDNEYIRSIVRCRIINDFVAVRPM